MATNNGDGFTFNFLSTALMSDNNRNTEKETASEGAAKDDPMMDASTEEQQEQRHVFGWIDVELLQEILTKLAGLYQKGELIHDEIPLSDTARPASTTVATASSANTHLGDESPLSLKCVKGSSLPNNVVDTAATKDDDVKDKMDIESTVKKQTDLIAGVYEGGLTVWECSLDLVRYFHEQQQGCGGDTIDSESPLSILELGCGHGLPTCYLLRRHYYYYFLTQRQQRYEQSTQQSEMTILNNIKHHVVLSDYNDYVLKDVTLANLFLNLVLPQQQTVASLHQHDDDDDANNIATVEATDLLKQLISSSQMQLGGGDWLGLSEQLRQDNGMNGEHERQEGSSSSTKFDVMIASETLYTMTAAKETCLLIQHHLQHDTGRAYIATKRYYFGLGGGVDAFQHYVTQYNNNQRNDFMMQVTTLQVHDNGAGNIREVLQVQLLSKKVKS